MNDPLDNMLRLPQVRKATGYATSTIYKKIKEETFPKQISLGPNAVGWLENDIKKWQWERILKSMKD